MALIERFTQSSSASEKRVTKIPRKKRAAIPSMTSTINLKRWIGLALLLASIVGGYMSVSRADHRTLVLAAVGQIPSGQVISAADVRPIRAAIDSSLYATDVNQVIGKAVSVDIVRGELLPLSLFTPVDPTRQVAIPVRSTNLPPLSRGDRVDIYSAGELVVADVPVVDVSKEATFRIVTISVAPEQTRAVVASLEDDVVVAKVP